MLFLKINKYYSTYCDICGDGKNFLIQRLATAAFKSINWGSIDGVILSLRINLASLSSASLIFYNNNNKSIKVQWIYSWMVIKNLA